MWQLGHSAGERGALGFDPVTSLGFSTVGAARDALWLAVGHASGSLSVWELQKRGPRQVAVIGECTWVWLQGCDKRAGLQMVVLHACEFASLATSMAAL